MVSRFQGTGRVSKQLRYSELQMMLVNAASGAAAGGLAAALTIPFDVVKTHTQTSHQHSPHAPQMNVMRATLDIAGGSPNSREFGGIGGGWGGGGLAGPGEPTAHSW